MSLDVRETFLRAVAAAPGDALPRLAYADWLDEHGDPAAAAALRAGPLPECDTIAVPADLLADPAAFRTASVAEYPEWFQATGLKVTGGLLSGAVPVETLFTAAATERVTRLDLRGIVTETPLEIVYADFDGFPPTYATSKPVVTVLGVQALAQNRGARRLTELLLTDNDLDNDAARLLARSPYLTRLARLEVLDGNRLRGRTWQLLLERFGEGVVS